MIIAHLIYDTSSLLACSLTCYSWYIASVPHLHYALTTRPGSWPYVPKAAWPLPLQNASKLGLLPLVKKFWVHAPTHCFYRFSSYRFNSRTLSQFSALTNVQELRLDNMDVHGFMPEVSQYFGHFLPTVRSLALGSPGGSHRQIIFFIGMFKHLEDLTLFNDELEPWQRGPADDPTLVPPFAPPLRGRLVASRLKREGLLKDMVKLFGGIRFRHMYICDVGETRLLLDACAETLETLQLDLTDPRGEQLYPKRMPSPANDSRQLNLPFWTLISRGTSRSEHSISMRDPFFLHVDPVRQKLSRVSSGPYSRPSRPSRSPRSL